jgi:hypothetical protein
VDLVKFDELRHLSWKGIGRQNEIDSSRDFIDRNGKVLENLTLDLIDWEKAEESWLEDYSRDEEGDLVEVPDNFFASRSYELIRG